jgi:hypothetical protein
MEVKVAKQEERSHDIPCPFLLGICTSKSKKEGKWACNKKYGHDDRMRMCTEYVRLWVIGNKERQ